MQAVTAIFSMDPSKKQQLLAGLEPVVIKMVRELPGFVTGFWSWDHASNVTYSFIAFDTQEHASALEAFLKGGAEKMAADGARLERVVVGEVVGAASGKAANKVDGPELWQRLQS